LFANENFQGFRLATLPLQYGERLILSISIAFDTSEKSLSSTRKSGNRRIRNYNLVQTERDPFRVLNYSTAFTTNKSRKPTKYPVLQQHFIGWFIKSEQAVFNMEQATFMDFR
jgi:lycopene beta-cyclase